MVQLALFQDDRITKTIVTLADFIYIPFNGDIIQHGQTEALRRLPHMPVRNPNADFVIRAKAAIDGFVVERHIKSFFSQKWPDFYYPASNEGRWQQGAKDDFGLALNGKLVTVDVARSKNLFPVEWKLNDKKLLGAKMIIVAFYHTDAVVMQGYTFQNDKRVLWSIERLIVRLNIEQMGISDLFSTYTGGNDGKLKQSVRRHQLRMAGRPAPHAG